MASILRIACLLFLTLASLAIAQDNPIPHKCYEGVQVIAVVGEGVHNGSRSYGLTVTFVEKVMAAVPHSGNYSLNYNRFPEVNMTKQDFIPDIDEGVPELYKALYNYTTACPNTPVVLHGYSEGAVVVANLLCGASSGSFPVTGPLNSSFAPQIIAVILYGDETRTANQPYNLGGCSVNAPHLPRRTPEGCAAFAPTMKSYCFQDDFDCCGAANASAPFLYNINPHFLYPDAYDAQAAAFVASQYATYKGVKPTSTSTTTSPTATITGTLSHAATCTTNACLNSMAANPATASSFCSALSLGQATTTIYRGPCDGDGAHRMFSVCNCLGIALPTATTTAS